ncbi:T9SS type A sorting domain-containing protein [Hymenobacter canadensis]|uniref:T9SS type A sorting domain-containing protein n=1 Tax=Hymenobacter canadensis TaxID=2999067 RepID=A0ABY7LR30_9BACT|nr:T9SS type A sorting domain-containing protein [Hymenobacter canadensis]WBA41902.1 T9SS type A sorting domain-containing protein [Hymenobacter canadensis]
MKHLYQLLLLLSSLTALPATAQNWRPFRPNGDVHAFRGTSADTVLTLRLDSAGVHGTDSVYYFNRIMRRTGSFAWQKARNNQFGQQLRYTPATRTYVLFWDGGPDTGLSLSYALVLKPFARVGDTWSSFFTDYGLTTTLVSRGTMMLDGVQDSVATFRAGNNPGVLVVLSKNNGLVSGPADLRFGVPAARQLTLARRPAPAGLSYYNPLTLLNLQLGDELGYQYTQFTSNPIGCGSGNVLRRILMRQLTADSLTYICQEQSRTVYSGAPGCVPASTTVSPVSRVRMSASLRTGQWRGSSSDRLSPLRAPLLSYAYQQLPFNAVLMGYPVVSNRPGGACSGPAALQTEVLYNRTGIGYTPGLDALNQQTLSAPGVGFVRDLEYQLTYTRRTSSGTLQTCGSRTDFATLLPTRAARAAATFQLYPNPAGSSATLTLAGPARTATTVRLLDALGRTAGTWPLAAGQTAMVLPLQALAAGMYVVEVQAIGERPQHLRLQLEK